MDHQYKNWINKYLTPDEYVVWNGRPGTGHLFTSYDIFMIPFSIMWCGFAVFWETMVLIMPAPIFFKLWGIPFVCVGLYMVFGRFIMKSYMRKETIYVITNKRIFFFRKNQMQTLDYHTNMTRKVTWHQDGSGSIRFSSQTSLDRLGFYIPRELSRQSSSFVLDNIPDVDHVLQILSN